MFSNQQKKGKRKEGQLVKILSDTVDFFYIIFIAFDEVDILNKKWTLNSTFYVKKKTAVQKEFLIIFIMSEIDFEHFNQNTILSANLF